MGKKTEITKKIVGNLSVDMIIALVLFAGLFTAYLNVREDWIRDMVNLVMGTIIGALRASMYHGAEIKDTEIAPLPANVKNEENPDFIVDIETKKE